MIAGRVSAIISGYRNAEAFQLAACGLDPKVYPVDTEGGPNYDQPAARQPGHSRHIPAPQQLISKISDSIKGLRMASAVEHRQLKDSVYLKLREEIVSTQLPPGYVLREAELASRFGVSKTPLREAFVRLEKDGFVSIPPYRSAVVAGYSKQDLREIYEVRELLEGLCAREAAAYITAEDLSAMNRVVRDSEQALASGDTERLTSLIDEFDTLLYAQCKNNRIISMLDNIRDHVTRIGRLTVAIPGRLESSVTEHRGIYEAIVSRDGPRAEQLMRLHILSVMADQLASLETS
jgi:DNA-binding GntR family transcriptional regulator